MRRRDQEITETTIETRDEGGVRFFIQVRLLHRRRESNGDGRAGRLLNLHSQDNIFVGRRMGGVGRF